jgi:hypothetical protein
MSDDIIVAFRPLLNLLAGYPLMEERIPQYCSEREEGYTAGVDTAASFTASFI